MLGEIAKGLLGDKLSLADLGKTEFRRALNHLLVALAPNILEAINLCFDLGLVLLWASHTHLRVYLIVWCHLDLGLVLLWASHTHDTNWCIYPICHMFVRREVFLFKVVFWHFAS